MAHTAALPVAQPAPPGLWVIHCDGSAIPNPGRMGLGATLLAPDGQQHTLSHTSSLVGCNNEAEALAAIYALQWLHAQAVRQVVLYTDNSILAEQLGAPQPKRIARLSDLYEQARSLLALFESVQLRWIPRHKNAIADALARGEGAAGAAAIMGSARPPLSGCVPM